MDEHIARLAKLFLKFPGIGQRQAARFAYFILTQPESYVDQLSKALKEARSQAHTCTRCFRIFEGTPGMCSICSNSSRDQEMILIVEKSQDIDSFSKTDYNGLFFVLGGLIPIVQKNVLEGTNIDRLINRVQSEKLSEVILAFPITPNGEHTDAVVRESIEKVSQVKVTSLGRGLSTGAELEYADSVSLEASLKKRE